MKRILMVDSAPYVIEMATRYLGDGFTVVAAYNGAQMRAFLAQHEQQAFDLVILAQRISPTEKGLDLALEVKAKNIPFIMMSFDGSVRFAARQAGAKTFIDKVDMHSVLRFIVCDILNCHSPEELAKLYAFKLKSLSESGMREVLNFLCAYPNANNEQICAYTGYRQDKVRHILYNMQHYIGVKNNREAMLAKAIEIGFVPTPIDDADVQAALTKAKS